MKTPAIPLQKKLKAGFFQLIPNFGLGTKDQLGQLTEDYFKISIVTKNLALQEVDIRKLRADIEGRSHLGHDFSYEKAEHPSLNNGAADQANAEQPDGEMSFNEGVFNLLKHLDNKPILQDYLRTFQKNPEEIKSHFDIQRNIFTAVFKNKLLVIDLKKMTVEGGSQHAHELSQIGFFQRKKQSRHL